MSDNVFTIAGAKGGVGKTTTSINLAAAVSLVTHQSAVVVDLDLAMANVLDFLRLDFDQTTDPTLHDVLAGDADISDIVYTAEGGIDVVPSGPDLDSYATTDPRQIGSIVGTLRDSHDRIFLDTGAGVSYETLLPLGLGDVVILVSTPRLAAVRDTEKTKDLAERVNTPIAGVVFVRAGTGKAPDVEHIANYLSVDLLGHVPEDGTIPESQDAGMPVLAYDVASVSAKAYWDIAERLDAGDFGTNPADVTGTMDDAIEYFSS